MKHALVIIAALVLALVAFAQDRAVVPVNNAVSAAIVQPGPTTTAKDWPMVEVFGGASYGSMDLDALGRRSAYGWETSVSNTVYRWFAIEGSVSGYYGQASALYCDGCVPPVYVTSHYRDYSFLGGPRFNLPKGLFFHALFGASRLSANAVVHDYLGDVTSPRVSRTSFALSPGFGVSDSRRGSAERSPFARLLTM
jgi:hypothetical protein